MPFELTDEQRAVINHPPTKHGRVIAGPGTGKSATAVALAEQLLTNSEPPLRVKFLTFTRAATAELARKLATSQAGILDRPSTIHSFAISTLLRNPGCASFPQPLRIPDKYEYKNLIRPHMAGRAKVGLRRLDDLVREMSAKWESLNPQENQRVTLQERARFMGVWLEHRQVFGYTLLDELPDLLRVALRDHDGLNGIDYQILIVDEYQDLNACDLEVMNRFAGRGISILAIGDDDQSIYSFRKAHPAGIRQFLRDFNTEHDYRLTVCHRSPERIVEWAQFVIQGDTSREERPAPTCRTDGPEGVTALLRFRGNISEARGVADLVKWLKDSQEIAPSEILILTRTDLHGTFTKPIKEELQQRNIPISDPNSIDTVISEAANRRLLAVLWLAVDPNDSLAWWTLLNLQPGIGDTFVQDIVQRAISTNTTFGTALADAATQRFPDSGAALRAKALLFWNEISGFLRAVQLSADSGEVAWGNWIATQIESNRLPPCSEELKRLFLEIDEIVEADIDLRRYLSQINPLGKDLAQTKSGGVRFMTMTSSKGLTVRATIIVGVDNDLIPRPHQDPGEERRLLYVAMTRSQKYLFLTWSNIRRGPAARSGRINIGPRQPSGFLRGGPVESQDGDEFVRHLASNN